LQHDARPGYRVDDRHAFDYAAVVELLTPRPSVAIAVDARQVLSHDAVAVGQRLGRFGERVGRIRGPPGGSPFYGDLRPHLAHDLRQPVLRENHFGAHPCSFVGRPLARERVLHLRHFLHHLERRWIP
jgi:hypothetical protein